MSQESGKKPNYDFFTSDKDKLIKLSNPSDLIEDLTKMILIRTFEQRAESAYLSGKVGGFFHSYIGQEAIQTAALRAFGTQNWYVTSYRCHALAILLGASVNELMAELYGKDSGNAKGRGGSMHFFTDKLLGGHGIVGGQIPIGTGAAFAAKYLGQNEVCSLTFLGDGAVAQGAFHESLNLASLWNLPALYIIENNQWGMGTHVAKAISTDKNIASLKALGYEMQSYTLNGMDYFQLVEGFKEIKNYLLEKQKPVLVEVVTERFKGHSISDPGLYRSKEDLAKCLLKDPISYVKNSLIENQIINSDQIKNIEEECKTKVLEAMRFAEEAVFPDPITLEEDVFAP